VLRVALKGILARKFRLVSTSFAVMLGVAFLSGTFVFTDTIQKAFDNLFADVFENTDSYVRSSAEVDDGFGGELHPRIPDSTIELVAGIDGVADAQGVIQAYAQVVGSDGDVIGDPSQGPPTFGANWLEGELSPWRLTEGSRPPGPGELVLDVKTAEDGGLEIGDMVSVITTSTPQEFPLVGTAKFGDQDSPGGASFAIFDLATAQELFHAPAQVDAVSVLADEGLSQQEITDRISAQLPEGLEALTGDEITEENTDAIQRSLSFLNIFLGAFAGIALFVGMFVIYNTFAITIAQRTRETALMRAVGASRRQVLGSLVLETFVVGLLASVLGLVVGIGLASGLHELFKAIGADIPSAGTVVKSRTVVWAVVVGTFVTMASGIFPSWRGARVPPLAALREVALDRSGTSLGRAIIGSTITALGILAVVAGISGAVGLIGLGAILLFVGVFVLSPVFARPVAKAIGGPIAAIRGVPGALARENSRRNPKRTSRTAAALMIGVALVAGVSILAASVKQSIRDVLNEQFVGDLVINSNSFGFGGLSPDLEAAVAQVPEVEVATGIRYTTGSVDGGDAQFSVIDPATAGRLFEVGVIDGELSQLTDDGIFLYDEKADDLDVTVGDTVAVQLIDGILRQLTVQGLYTEQQLAGNYTITQGLSEASGADQFDLAVYVQLAPGVTLDQGKAALEPIVDEYPNAELQDRDTYVDDTAATVDGFVTFIYILLLFAVIIAVFGIANTLVLSVHERTRELGLLRAVGSSRGQVRAMIRWESVIIGLFGTILGLVIALFLGYSFVRALRDDGIETFAVSWVFLGFILVLAIVFAVLAGLRPAYRAGKLNILRAIAHE
jgi:putative ABC transport system permease protein